jgi:transposase
MQVVAEARAAAAADPERVRVVYADEVTCYRQPVVRQDWQLAGSGGRNQKKAPCCHAANSKYRYLATLDACTGRVLFCAHSRMAVQRIAAFLRNVRRAYGPHMALYLVWDNWPMHYYDLVLSAAAESNITLLYLPTYAPWTNPIEKLWRKMRDEVTAMHRDSDRWPDHKAKLRDFLTAYDRDAPDLLRYVGLAA